MDVILHHYMLSPYAEKARIALGLKGIDWLGVTIPVVMPKPELIALTGGYRRTPVLQIGADIYCDTTMILIELERRKPAPTLWPGGEGLNLGLSWWIEKSCFTAVAQFTASLALDRIAPDFMADRRAFFDGGFDPESIEAAKAHNIDTLRAHLTSLAQMLSDDRRFLLGDAPGAADLAAYVPVSFLRRSKKATAAIDVLADLAPWAERIAAIGHGASREISGAEALRIAHAARPEASSLGVDPNDSHALKPGERVAVAPDDMGRDETIGALVGLSAQAIVVARTTPQTGDIHVHFPRAGFAIRRAAE
jgi:glutathione S-transferase